MAQDEVSKANGFAEPVTVRVPSKLNLFLAVRGLRADGYHELVTVMQTLSIHDRLTAWLQGSAHACLHPAARKHMELKLQVQDGAGVPPDGDNLAVQAGHRLLSRLGAARSRSHDDRPAPRDRPASANEAVTVLDLTKSIPVSAGMAGGSADAAAALVALNELWGCGLDREALQALGADLGADVPFCVVGGTVLATGTGTATARVLCRGSYSWVVGVSHQPLATPAVYRAWDEVARPSTVEPDAVLAALRTGDPELLGAALHNDLEEAAFALRPELRTHRDAFLEAGALGAVVSGSGPTVVGLARDASDAHELARRVGHRFDRVEVAASPAGGPEVTGRDSR